MRDLPAARVTDDRCARAPDRHETSSDPAGNEVKGPCGIRKDTSGHTRRVYDGVVRLPLDLSPVPSAAPGDQSSGINEVGWITGGIGIPLTATDAAGQRIELCEPPARWLVVPRSHLV